LTLANGLISRTIDTGGDTRGGGARLVSLRNARTGFDWAYKGRPADLYLVEGQKRLAGLAPESGFRLLRKNTRQISKGALECRLDFLRESPETMASTIWTGFPGCPVIQHQCVIANTGKGELTDVSRFDPIFLWLRDDGAPVLAHWVQGMRGSDSGQPDPEPYETLRYRREPLERTLRLVGGRRSAELDTAWLALENTRAAEILFLGIEWAGEWGIRVLRQDGGLLLIAGVINSRHDLAPGSSLSSPRVFVGAVHGDINDATREMHRYLLEYVMPARLKDFPWVTYEPWLPMAANMEEAYWPEVQVAAEIGVECFYIGPHWYEGSNQNLEVGNHNYTPGLGTWRENRQRFPNGLANFSRRVNSLGLKFGLWLEPERIDDRLVPGEFPRSFLASRGGVVHKRLVRDGKGFWDPPGAAVCLGNPEVVAWLKDALSRIVEDYGIDWIKWDNNFFEICDDPGHGHQAGNGDYAHMLGVYAVWEHLSTKFPQLVIENCAGGGNRMDFGLARYCRTNWLADSTAPSYRVRYHVAGAGYLFPAPYLYSWIWTPRVNQPGIGDSLAMNLFMSGTQELVDEPHSDGFLDNLFRSRMLGACGIGLNGLASARISFWNQEVREAAKRNIREFKNYRHLLWEDLYRLTPQAALYWPALNAPAGWEIVQYAKRDGSEAVLLCFRGTGPEASHQVRPMGLASDASYVVTSVNQGRSRQFTGSAIGRDGLTVEIPEKLGSEILRLSRV
jgi:alpha-galactosidase